MVHWIWVVIAGVAGGIFGFGVSCLLVVGSEYDKDYDYEYWHELDAK